MDRIWGSFMNDIKEDMRQQTGNSLDTIAEIETDSPDQAATSNKTQKRRKRRQRKQMPAQTSSSASSWQSDLPVDWQNVITLWMVLFLNWFLKKIQKRMQFKIHVNIVKTLDMKKLTKLKRKNLLTKMTCGLFTKFKPVQTTLICQFFSQLQINLTLF